MKKKGTYNMLKSGILSLLIYLLVSPVMAQKASYNWVHPDKVSLLPDTLREVSGVAILNKSVIACIQDEQGIVFLYDTQKDTLFKQIRFARDGDFEGICKVQDTLYVLRSDGVLFEIRDFDCSTPEIRMYPTGILTGNHEGLCYDGMHHRLLIASKGKSGKGLSLRDRRHIYGFDLYSKTLSTQPTYDIHLNSLLQFAFRQGIALPLQTKEPERKGKAFNLRTSAIAIHPITQHIYLLAAANYMLVVLTSSGEPVEMFHLDPKIFNKAEGIDFYPNGDILITNEAQGNKPTLLRFNYR